MPINLSGSLELTGSLVISGSITTTGPITISGSIASSSFAATASSADNFLTRGTLTAQTLVVQTITSSVMYSSGSNVFGNNIVNTQVLTGSVTVTGSLAVVTNGTEFQVTSTGVRLGNVIGDAHNITGSLLTTGSVRFGASNQQTSGTEKIYVGQNSAVGIDDANSLSLSVAHAAATGSPQISFTYQFRTNDNAGANLYGDAVKVIKNAGASSTYTVFATNSTIGAGTERMRITSTGNVGINTNDPSGLLQLNGAIANSADAAAFTIKQSSTSYNNGIYIERSGERNGYHMYIGGSVDSLNFRRNYVGTQSDVMSLTRDGNVGIGTSNPSQILDVRKATASGDTQFNFANSQNSSAGNTSVTSTIYLGFYDDSNGLASVNKIVSGKSGDYTSAPTANSFLAFYTTAANSCLERMRITKSGGVQVGSTAGAGTSDIGVFVGGFSSSKINLWAGYSGGAAGMNITDASGNTTVQFFGSTGNYAFAGSNVSDRRAKTNIQEITSGLPNLLQLKPSTFAYNNHPNNTKGGFIAQEVLEIIPEFVTIPEDETEMMGVDYNGILALAVKAIQELTARVQELENK